MVDLQEEGGQTGETGNTREASDLGGTGGGNGRRGLGGLLTRGRNGGASGLGNTRDGAVGVGRRRRDSGGLSGLRAVVADDGGGGDHGLGDGARAVGDGQSGGLSDRVGLVTVGDLGGSRAVGDVGLDDLSDDGNVLVSHGASGGKGESESVLHLDGIRCLVGRLVLGMNVGV